MKPIKTAAARKCFRDLCLKPTVVAFVALLATHAVAQTAAVPRNSAAATDEFSGPGRSNASDVTSLDAQAIRAEASDVTAANSLRDHGRP